MYSLVRGANPENFIALGLLVSEKNVLLYENF